MLLVVAGLLVAASAGCLAAGVIDGRVGLVFAALAATVLAGITLAVASQRARRAAAPPPVVVDPWRPIPVPGPSEPASGRPGDLQP